MYPRVLVTDFDGTITEKDTISLIADAAYIVKPDFAPFSKYIEIYLDAYNKHAAQFKRRYGLVDSIAKENLFQKDMQAVETSSIDAIESDGLFEDVPLDLIKNQTALVSLRPGCIQYLKACLENDVRVIILSLNWSRLFIAECLHRNGLSGEVEIIASDFEYVWKQGQMVSTGKWDNINVIRTALDKRDYIRSLNTTDLWYIGDSVTDLLAGMEASKGIAIENTSLVGALDERQISYGQLAKDGSEYYTATWMDLNAFCNM